MKSRFGLSILLGLALCTALYGQEHSNRPSPPPQTTPTATPNATDRADGWVNFSSTDGLFTVLMPDTPTEKTETTQSEHGPYTTHLFVLRGESNVFLIGWVDYDPSFNFNRQAELEANRDNFVKGINATLRTTRSLTLSGYSAIEFTADTADRTFLSRVYMVGRRPYQIVIGVPKGGEDSSDATKFFNSFKVRLR